MAYFYTVQVRNSVALILRHAPDVKKILSTYLYMGTFRLPVYSKSLRLARKVCEPFLLAPLRMRAIAAK